MLFYCTYQPYKQLGGLPDSFRINAESTQDLQKHPRSVKLHLLDCCNRKSLVGAVTDKTSTSLLLPPFCCIPEGAFYTTHD